MHQIATLLTFIGVILLLGLATDYLGRRTFLPRVTLLLLIGVLIGKDALDLVPEVVVGKFELITEIALLMVGFLLGGRLTLENLLAAGSQMLWISIGAVVVTTGLVFIGLFSVGAPFPVAVVLGCIAAATAPAATVDIVLESGFKGRFVDLLLAIVAIDDAWALMVFSFGLAMLSALTGPADFFAPLLLAGYEIGGAILLGLLLGVPAAYLTGRIRPGQPMLTEALGLVFLCGGLALRLEVSFLVSAMVMGAAIANLAKHHEYPFHEIENIEQPFMVIFFILAGASLEIALLGELGIIGAAYVICRLAGKYLGAVIGSYFSHAPEAVRRWMGLALLPQAGVAIGMALVASHQFPQYRQMILSLVIGATVLFELIGPLLSRFALNRAGSAGE